MIQHDEDAPNCRADVAEIMLDYAGRGTTHLTDAVKVVPSSHFTDVTRWQAEIDLIFKRLPLILALSCELPKPGDYKAMEVIGLPVLIVRDKGRKVRAFFNVCAHRWMPVASEGHGNCSRFTCPYHGWTFGADGKLLVIAASETVGDIDRSTRGLRELPCEERHGLIFVCLTPELSMDLDGLHGPLLAELANVGLKDRTFLCSRVIEGPNWKLAMENFFEGYHIAASHPNTVAKVLMSNTTHYEGFGPDMRVNFASRTISKLNEMPRSRWGEREETFVTQRFLFPNVTGGVRSDAKLASINQIIPGSTPETSRQVWNFTVKDAPADNDEREVLIQQVDAAIQILAEEDVGSGLKVQKGLKTGAYDGLIYGRNERGNQYFHEWVDWYLKDNPSIPKPHI